MRKILSSLSVLLLGTVMATVPVITTSEDVVVTSGGLVPIQTELVPAFMPYYPNNQTWDTCVINGETLKNVSFVYTELGLGYIVDDVLIYRSIMEVEVCKTAILKVSDTESNIR
jgi:hypothetical protein